MEGKEKKLSVIDEESYTTANIETYTNIKCLNGASRQGIMDKLVELGRRCGNIEEHPFEDYPYVLLLNRSMTFYLHTGRVGNIIYNSEEIWWLD